MKKAVLLFFVLTACLGSRAQMNEYVIDGEFGFAAGAAHYFGDLNTQASIRRPKPSFGVFFRKQFGNYIAVRLAGNYARVGFSDEYSKNEFNQRRNLSFNSDIWEIALQGDFNFFKFFPGSEYYRFTPYVTLGVGFFNSDPYAYLDGKKYYLRSIGTEGQGSSLYPERTPYKTMALCFPLGMGVKYSLTDRINLGFEIAYRFTRTDYLDDVSTTYAPDAFPLPPSGDPTPAYLLQDRSYATGDGVRIGVKGRQRGFSEQNDAYAYAHLTISFVLSSYKCPSAE